MAGGAGIGGWRRGCRPGPSVGRAGSRTWSARRRVVGPVAAAAAPRPPRCRAGAPGRAGMTHAWLFTGPPGSGRSVAARAFAAALLCADQGCGQCPSCHQVAAGGHADLLLVRPDGLSYGVRQTRDLVLRAAAAPVVRPVAGGPVRGRRPRHRAGRERAAQGHRGTRAADRLAALRARPRTTCPPRSGPGAAWSPCARRPPPRWPRCWCAPGSAATTALAAARAAQGHIGRARRLATDPQAAGRRAEVLKVPMQVSGPGRAAAWATRSPRRRRWSRRPRRKPPRSPRNSTCPSGTRCAGPSAKAPPARGSPPPSAARPAR